MKPLQPGETNPTHKCPGPTSSTASDPLRDRPAPPLDGVPYSLGLGTPGKPFAPDPRSIAVRGKRRVSEEIAFSFEVPSLLADLVTLEPSQVRAYELTSELDTRLRSPVSSLDLNQLLPGGYVVAVSAAGSEPDRKSTRLNSSHRT